MQKEVSASPRSKSIAIRHDTTTHNDRVQSGVIAPSRELPERARLDLALESVLRRVTLSGDTAATRVR